MKFGIIAAGALIFACSFNANAQSMWGAGAYGAAQACPYQTELGDGASSYIDEIRESEKAIKEATREMQSKKREKKRLEEKARRARAAIEAVVSDSFTETIFAHMENGNSCAEYFPEPPTASTAGGDEEGQPIQKPPAKETVGLGGFTPAQWAGVCTGKGTVSSKVCQSPEFRSDDSGRRSQGANCSTALKDYRESYKNSQRLQTEIENLDESIKAARDSIKDSKQAMADELRDQQEDTESGVCVDCMARASGYGYQRRGTDWGNVVGNVATGLLGIYAGYQTNKMVAQYNSNIGQATTPYPAVGYGLPYIAAGLYGAMGGSTGQGGFGCGASNGGMYGGMGGAFGYPPGMYGSPYGGGMYGGMGMPMGGMMGMPMGGMMGGAMGMPMGGGYMMGGGLGGMMGMPMGGMMGGAMGMPMGGMMGMPMGGAMGMPMGGGYMMGGGLGGMMGMPMGGMMGGAMGMPMGGMMGSMMDSMGSMQMQQQMMQMQMQQYQQYMQQMQAYQQQQMQKQQVVAGLQTELYGLINRIQQIQYGGGFSTTGYIGGTTTGYGGSITGGVITGGGLTPLSTTPTATTPLNSR